MNKFKKIIVLNVSKNYPRSNCNSTHLSTICFMKTCILHKWPKFYSITKTIMVNYANAYIIQSKFYEREFL